MVRRVSNERETLLDESAMDADISDGIYLYCRVISIPQVEIRCANPIFVHDYSLNQSIP